MIQKIGDYYVFEEVQNLDQHHLQAQLNSVSPSQQNHIIIGNIKQRIQLIRERFETIKKQKAEQDKKTQLSNKNIFEKLKIQEIQNKNEIDIELYIPEEVLKLEQRICKIEQKLNPNQILKRKMDQRGPLVDRINILHQKLTKILETSSQIIIGNIQTYCSSLDDKEDHLKILFLKEAFSKTQGMKEQILVLQKYLNNLNQVQIKIKSIDTINQTSKNHNELLILNNKLSSRIRALFQNMKSEYEKICKQIEQINI